MAYFLYASFPNSRIKTRPATTQALQNHYLIVNQSAPGLTLVVPQNPNFASLTIQNLSATVSAWYLASDETPQDPTVVAQQGNPGDYVVYVNDLTYPLPSILYQKQDTGVTTNWLAVNINTHGQLILPQEIVPIDTPQFIWMAANQNAGAQITVAVYQGIG